MTVSKATWVWAGVLLAVVVGLPLARYWARRGVEPGCALDGVKIDPRYRVEVTDDQGRRHAFCCVQCARRWLDRQDAPPHEVKVTDESSGEPLDAARAYYVRSFVVTTPVTGNRIHVFRTRADAEQHAETHNGTVLPASERPLP
jgi:hypothetical protein